MAKQVCLSLCWYKASSWGFRKLGQARWCVDLGHLCVRLEVFIY